MKDLNLKVLIFVLLLLTSITTLAQNNMVGNKNVLFIAVDDLRAELNCYGSAHMKTPNIDKLASTGMLFANAHTQQAICTPSRISMMLGLRPSTTGMYGLEDKMKHNHSNLISIPHALKNAGYKTYSLGKIYHHNDDDPEAWTENPWRNVGSHYTKNYDPGINPPTEANHVPDNHYPDGKIADQAIARLEQIKDDQFFLAVGFMKPHLPFTCPQKYWDLYDRSQITLPSKEHPNDISDYTLTEWHELRNQYSGIPTIEEGDLSEELSKELKHGYWACVSFIDAQIGRVINKLEELGLRDNTIIVLWSDHGWKLGEYGDWCKHTCMEVDVRVPFMIDAPGMESGVSNRPVEAVDIYPTLMDLLSIENYPDNLDGISMKPLLENPNAEWKKAVFAQYPRYGGIMGTTVRTVDYRYTEYRDQTGNVIEYGELYDHTSADVDNPLGVEYNNVVRNSTYELALNKMQNLMNAGWNGVRYGASLSIKDKSDNSVTLAINTLPEAGELKLFQRVGDEDAIEILEGQITQTTKEVTIDNLEQGKAYYFKLQIEWDEGKYNYCPEVGVVFGTKTMLVDNGDFSSELSSGWNVRQSNEASMTSSINDGKLNASVSQIGVNFWDLGFLNKKTSSFSNQDVIISFWAKTSEDADIRFTLDFEDKQYPIQNLTTNWERYSLRFENVSSSSFQFKMWLTSEVDYLIDDIEVYYGSVPSVELNPQGGQGTTIGSSESNSNNKSFFPINDFYLSRTSFGYTIKASENVEQWQLFDINGREVLSENDVKTNSFDLNLSSIENGIYILLLNRSISQKLIW